MMEADEISSVIERVRQGLKAEGGDIEVIDVKDGVMYVRLKGSCESCPMAGLTMRTWVEKTIKEAMPSIKSVKAI
ncbi:MAG: NifU family protein [Nitrospirae bacterium]|nr:NifU family protein [Nitrospirota bacterium]